MRETFLPFSRPSFTESDIGALGAVLRSGWITTGKHAAKFEQEFAAYVDSTGKNAGRSDAPRAIAVSSGTAGMHLVLMFFGIGPGDEVITPSMTWVSTVNLIVLSGAKPVFVDINRDTMLVIPSAIEQAITDRTKLIIPVHFAGAPADLNAIQAIAAKRSIPVIEDSAHAIGAKYAGRKIGAAGTNVFSFHPIKNITTGEGGMVCSDNLQLCERVRRLKFHGLGIDAFDRQVQGRPPEAEVIEPGYKYNMIDLSAVLGCQQLAKLDNFNRKRFELAMRYRERLSEVDEILPLEDPPYPISHAWHLFVIRLDSQRAGMSRSEFMQALKRRNIGTGLHFKAVHLQKYYRENMGFARGLLPNTEWNSDRICSLPLFPDMSMDDVDDVIEGIKEVLTTSA